MRKPVKPSRPRGISKMPSKTILVAHEKLLKATNFPSLKKEIVNFLIAHGVKSPSDKDIADAKIIVGRQYSYSYHVSIQIQIQVPAPNDRYESQLEVYNRNREANEEKIRKYKEAMDKYNTDMLTYLKWFYDKEEKAAREKVLKAEKDVEKQRKLIEKKHFRNAATQD